MTYEGAMWWATVAAPLAILAGFLVACLLRREERKK